MVHIIIIMVCVAKMKLLSPRSADERLFSGLNWVGMAHWKAEDASLL
jgi:hypothetical protein